MKIKGCFDRVFLNLYFEIFCRILVPDRHIRRSGRVGSRVEQASSRPRRVRLSDAQPPPRLVCRYEYISRHDNACNQHGPSDSRAAQPPPTHVYSCTTTAYLALSTLIIPCLRHCLHCNFPNYLRAGCNFSLRKPETTGFARPVFLFLCLVIVSRGGLSRRP